MVFVKSKKVSFESFTECIRIETIHGLSKEAKLFLKNAACNTLFDLLYFTENAPKEVLEKLSTTPRRVHVEICELRLRITTFVQRLELVVKNKVHFSENIARPIKLPTGENRRVLIALLLFEPFFGNRRGITKAKHLHLPSFYSEDEKRNREIKATGKTPFRVMRQRIAA